MRFWHSASNNEVLERLESLERRFKTLLADVDEYFQLVRRAENRIKEKRAKIESDTTAEGVSNGQGAVPDTIGSHGTTLSDRQKQIQQVILRRRAGLQ